MTFPTDMNFTPAGDAPVPKLSVVMPCLNEADTLGLCIETAQAICLRHGISHEIIIADNGSTDGSIEIAQACGARVVPVERRGYGSALPAGIGAARAESIVMGDADDSYDFRAIPKFFHELSAGNEYVQGCRLPSGGGRVLSGAMPWSHRYVGNPFFSLLARSLLNVPVHDVYCGLRGFTKRLYDELPLHSGGMVFAIEMVVQAARLHAKTSEIPVTLRPDGRKAHGSHLRTVRDGCRTLRYLLGAWWSESRPAASEPSSPRSLYSSPLNRQSRGLVDQRD